MADQFWNRRRALHRQLEGLARRMLERSAVRAPTWCCWCGSTGRTDARICESCDMRIAIPCVLGQERPQRRCGHLAERGVPVTRCLSSPVKRSFAEVFIRQLDRETSGTTGEIWVGQKVEPMGSWDHAADRALTPWACSCSPPRSHRAVPRRGSTTACGPPRTTGPPGRARGCAPAGGAHENPSELAHCSSSPLLRNVGGDRD
jgi:hypothetical protein